MKDRKQLEKYGGVVLALLCVFLVFKLVQEIRGSAAPTAEPETTVSAPPPNPAQVQGRAPAKAAAPLSSHPSMQVQTLSKYVPKPFPDISRDPFGFGPPPLTPAQKAAQAARAAGGAMTASTASPQSRISLRAIGYNERIGVGPEAFLVDSDEVYVVHDGDVVSRRYKILKITSLMVQVKDGVSGEEAQLPIPEIP
jgi:hypothetical protein